jgi:hypothetical protein
MEPDITTCTLYPSAVPKCFLLGKHVAWENEEGKEMEGMIEGVSATGNEDVMVVTLEDEWWIFK